MIKSTIHVDMPAIQGKIVPAVTKALLKGTYLGALKVQGVARNKILKGPRSGRGRKYRRGRRLHTASIAGEPPANDTGNLAMSIQAVAAKIDGQIVLAQVVAGADYAEPLENGRKANGGQDARPFMSTSADESKAAVSDIVAKAVAEALK